MSCPRPPPYNLLTGPERNLTIFYGIHSSIGDFDSFIQSNKGSLQAKTNNSSETDGKVEQISTQ